MSIPSHRTAIAVAIGAVLALAAACLLPTTAEAKTIHDVPLPSGSKSLEPNLFSSSRGFRKTVRHIERFLKRQGQFHEAIPVYRYRGTAVARFISKQQGARWAAIHVFRTRGITFIYVVPARPLTEGSRGKDRGHGRD